MLRDFVSTSRSPEEIGHLLTMAGFELEEIYESEGEVCFDVNIMANRGDGASVLGMARELIAKDPESTPTELFKTSFSRTPLSDSRTGDACRIEIQTEACSRFCGAVYHNIQNGESPDWLKTRLTQCGQRPISLLVDLTNYVMLEQGQPMHAYDLSKLAGGQIIVRQAREGEKIKTLDGVERDLSPSNMIIADAEKPIGIAGVMGGEDTEVSDTTITCLLEAAHFNNVSVRATRKAVGLQTEASYRFERHVDPAGVYGAMERFEQLYNQITGDVAQRLITDVYPTPLANPEIVLDMDRCTRLLGMQVSAEEAVRILESLGFKGRMVDGSPAAIAPTWRSDILRQDDLIEEVGRIYGYEKIPECLPQGTTTPGGVMDREAMVDRLVEESLRCGLNQIISHSLGDVHPLDRPGDKIRVRTPHSPEMACLRNSNLPCCSDAVKKNGGKDVHLFEVGRVFEAGREYPQLAFLSTGGSIDVHFANKPSAASFWTAKGIVDRLGKAVRVELTYALSSGDRRFHPTRQAELLCGDLSVGVLGQIHPDIAEELGMSEVFGAEIDLEVLYQASQTDPKLKSVSRNPAATRDIAVLIAKSVPYSEIEKAVAESGGEELEKHWLFDVYEGKGIPEGSHSLAIGLQLRKHGANFTDEQANQVRDRIVAALESLGATLR